MISPPRGAQQRRPTSVAFVWGDLIFLGGRIRHKAVHLCYPGFIPARVLPLDAARDQVACRQGQHETVRG